jgi:hypothetical protein
LDTQNKEASNANGVPRIRKMAENDERNCDGILSVVGEYSRAVWGCLPSLSEAAFCGFALQILIASGIAVLVWLPVFVARVIDWVLSSTHL